MICRTRKTEARPACLAALLLLAWAFSAEARTWVVDRNHPKADDAAPGSEGRPFRTIGPAAEKARPGDTVLVRAGIYRERVAPARGGEAGKPITYAAAPNERVVLKGSDVYAGEWEPVAGHAGVFVARLDRPGAPDFGDHNPFAIMLKRKGDAKGARRHILTLGQVFVGGRRLRECYCDERNIVLATPGTWMSEGGGNRVLVHFPDADRVPGSAAAPEVEIAVRGRIFAPHDRGLGHITVRGFEMEHCANQFPSGFWASDSPQAGALGCRGGHHWVIENNTIRWAKSLGLDCGSEGDQDIEGRGQAEPTRVGHHLVRRNVISDNGCGGIAGYRALRTRFIGNVLERNNYLGHTAPECAGIKTHFLIGGHIEGNLFRDNETFGLWLDNVYAHTRVTRNVFLGNRDAGLFIEMGGGPVLVDNNVIALTRGNATSWHNGSGVYAHDAGGITLAHNLIVFNANWGVLMRQATNRSYSVYPDDIQTWETEPTDRKPCLPENIALVNNLFLDNHRGAVSLPLPGPNASGNSSDGNVFSSGGLALVPFVPNAARGTKPEDAVERLREAWEKAGVPEAERVRPPMYQNGPLLGLEDWQRLGFDLHSTAPALRELNVIPHEFEVTLRTRDWPWEVECQPVADVDRDFFGRPVPAKAPLPGPFQSIEAGGNRFVLWPVPVPERP